MGGIILDPDELARLTPEDRRLAEEFTQNENQKFQVHAGAFSSTPRLLVYPDPRNAPSCDGGT